MSDPSMMTPRERDEWEDQQARREEERLTDLRASMEERLRPTYDPRLRPPR